MLGHIVWTRCRVLGLAGEATTYPWLDKFAGGARQSEGSDYPTLRELGAAYSEVSEAMNRRLEGLSDAVLLEAVDDVPGEQEPTLRGVLTFWVWQDCYHLGQVGSILTTLGLTDFEALHYRRKQRLTSEPA